MNKQKEKIYVAGHTGLVGSAIMRALKDRGYTNIVTKSHSELDLTNQTDVEAFFMAEKPSYVIFAAARVGGIAANMDAPAQFLYDNLMMECNVIHSAYKTSVSKLIFLASSCIYPRLSPQPMKEEYLLDGKPEPTNEGYAIAKITGVKLCEMYRRQYGCNFVSLMPCNIYGQGDNFDPVTSHVVAALIRKAHEAKAAEDQTLIMWGTGAARRELMYVDDLASACMFALENNVDDDLINVGTGQDIAMSDLISLICSIVGFDGDIVYDTSKPDGMPQKLLDTSKLDSMGWKAETSLEEGIAKTYSYFLEDILD